MAITVSGTAITFNDATTQTTAAGTSIPGVLGQVFTSSGTFTIPTGVTAIKVTVVGAGGGGSNGDPCYGGANAGGGATGIQFFTGLTPANTLTVTVGTGGTNGTNGNTGGTSSVASGTQSITTVQSTGGTGGQSYGPFTVAGAGGTATGGALNIKGGAGAAGYGSGAGGSSLFSPTMSYIANSAGRAGIAYGGGGNGGNSSSGAGGTGGAGMVLIEW